MLSKGKRGEEIEAREREGKELRHVEGMMESQGKRKENEELHDRVGREGKCRGWERDGKRENG